MFMIGNPHTHSMLRKTKILQQFLFIVQCFCRITEPLIIKKADFDLYKRIFLDNQRVS